MTLTSLTKKDIAKSLTVYIFGAIGLGLTVFLMTVVNEGTNCIEYIKSNYADLLVIAFTLIIMTGIMYCYFFFENKYILHKVGKSVEIFILLYLSLMLNFAVGEFIDAAARPVAFLAIMSVTLFRRRDAVFINNLFAILMLIIDRFSTVTSTLIVQSYACMLTTFCAGIVAIFVFHNIKTRIEGVLVALILLIPVEIIEFIINVSSVKLNTMPFILMYGAVGCLLSVMLYMFLLPVFEILFSELTVFRLREMTGDNAKLIRRLKNNAAGTYNHSVVVAQLVEACAKEIGEDSELARAAAYYHDVGKLKNPEMFAENQHYDFHAELAPELSVDIIRSHARDGAQLIRKNRLPEFFADVAVQHHGTLPIKYFYVKALKMSDGEINIDNYSYSGPTPTTKIAALIMIADAAEAATRSLTERSPDNVEMLVRSLIEERLDSGQFDNCNITMRELSVVRSTIVSQLTGVYHSRVEYPKIQVSKKK